MDLYVVFEAGTDTDIATVEVNNRVKRVEALMPQPVLQNGIRVDQTNPQMLQIVTMYSEDPRFDQAYLSNLANATMVPELKRVGGDRLGAGEVAVDHDPLDLELGAGGGEHRGKRGYGGIAAVGDAGIVLDIAGHDMGFEGPLDVLFGVENLCEVGDNLTIELGIIGRRG